MSICVACYLRKSRICTINAVKIPLCAQIISIFITLLVCRAKCLNSTYINERLKFLILVKRNSICFRELEKEHLSPFSRVADMIKRIHKTMLSTSKNIVHNDFVFYECSYQEDPS